MKILVVEDEDVLRDVLKDLFTDAGYKVCSTHRGEEAVAFSREQLFDLVVLDWMLPDIDGITVLKKIRRIKPYLPILMLTARSMEEDKVLGLDEGADDYLTKPFHTRELLARVRVFERRIKLLPSEPEKIVSGIYVFDFLQRVAVRGDVKIHLTVLEAAILQWLYRNRRRAVPRKELLERVWGIKAQVETRSVDMAMALLRKKLEVSSQKPELIVTIKNEGYKWGVE